MKVVNIVGWLVLIGLGGYVALILINGMRNRIRNINDRIKKRNQPK